MTCLRCVYSFYCVGKAHSKPYVRGVLNRRDMQAAYTTMPKPHSPTQTLKGSGMETYKEQTGHCFRMEILEATNTMGKLDYEQCRFENYCQKSRILGRKEVYFGPGANFRPENFFEPGADCLLSRAWLAAEWGRSTSSSSSTPGWAPTIKACSLRKTLVVLTFFFNTRSFLAGMKCDQQDQNIASGSCARYIDNGSL